jgi:hypothetical protein
VQQGVKLILDGERRGIIPKIMHLDAVLSTNAFSLSPDDPKSPARLFLNASRVNHSCVPNADYSYNNKSGFSQRAKRGLCIELGMYLEGLRRPFALAVGLNQLKGNFSLVKHPEFLPVRIPKIYALAIIQGGGGSIKNGLWLRGVPAEGIY